MLGLILRLFVGIDDGVFVYCFGGGIERVEWYMICNVRFELKVEITKVAHTRCDHKV